MADPSTCNDWTLDQWSNVSFVKAACGDLVPDTDIAGVGVLAAFVATSVLTILLCIGKAVCLLVLEEDSKFIRDFVYPPAKKGTDTSKEGTDRSTRFPWLPGKKKAGQWNDIFGKLVIGLADQQMVTGFAILVAAIELRSNTAAYNFFIMAHVGAFALVTQTMGFLVCFDVIHRSFVLHSIRMLVYSVTLALFYACAYQSFDLTGDQGYRAACPATCEFKKGITRYVELLVVGLPIYAFILGDYIKAFLHWLKKSDHPDDDPTKNDLTPSQPHSSSNLLYYAFEIVRVFVWLCTIAELGVAMWTVWTSWYINQYNQLNIKDGFSEKAWGFGQLVAVILIPLPFLSFLEERHEVMERSKEEEAHKESPKEYDAQYSPQGNEKQLNVQEAALLV